MPGDFQIPISFPENMIDFPYSMSVESELPIEYASLYMLLGLDGVSRVQTAGLTQGSNKEDFPKWRTKPQIMVGGQVQWSLSKHSLRQPCKITHSVP